MLITLNWWSRVVSVPHTVMPYPTHRHDHYVPIKNDVNVPDWPISEVVLLTLGEGGFECVRLTPRDMEVVTVRP